jgi:hypothetical protein
MLYWTVPKQERFCNEVCRRFEVPPSHSSPEQKTTVADRERSPGVSFSGRGPTSWILFDHGNLAAKGVGDRLPPGRLLDLALGQRIHCRVYYYRMLQGDARDLDATARLAASAMTAHAERHRREFSSKLSARIIRHDQGDDEEHRMNTQRSKIRKVSPRNVSVVAGSTPSSVSSNGDEEGDDGDADEDAFVAARTNATRKSALPAAVR